MSKTTNKFAPEVGERAVRMVLDYQGDHPSGWAAITSIAEKIGCSGHTRLEWVKQVEVNSGKGTGVPTGVSDKLKALERENRELPQANEILRKASAYLPRRGSTAVQAMIAFIDEHHGDYRGEPICRVLPIAPSTYHEHLAQRRDPSWLSSRAQRDQMKSEVVQVFAEKFGV